MRTGRMGNTGGKGGRPKDPETSPVIQIKNKYGDDLCNYLLYWHEKHGFPDGRSLSQTQLKKIRENLEEKKQVLMKWEKVKCKDIQEIDTMDGYLKLLEAECEKRDRHACQQVLTSLKVGKNKKDSNKDTETW